jgi:EPS-associated MarR family transcriptional regulator
VASRREAQQEDVRFRVLRLLDENPELSVRDIAATVGGSNGAAYYSLSALVQKGLIKLSNFTASEHKGRYAYVLTPRGIKEKTILTARFLRRKLDEYEDLRREIELLKQEVSESAMQESPGPRLGRSVGGRDL